MRAVNPQKELHSASHHDHATGWAGFGGLSVVEPTSLIRLAWRPGEEVVSHGRIDGNRVWLMSFEETRRGASDSD